MQGTEWKHKCIERKNMEKRNRGNIKWRRKEKDGVDWLIGDQEDFKAKNITGDKKDHFTMIKGPTYSRAEKLIELQKEVDTSVIIV